MVDLHDISSVRGLLDGDVWETELEPIYVVGRTVDDIAFSRGLEAILKLIGGI